MTRKYVIDSTLEEVMLSGNIPDIPEGMTYEEYEKKIKDVVIKNTDLHWVDSEIDDYDVFESDIVNDLWQLFGDDD